MSTPPADGRPAAPADERTADPADGRTGAPAPSPRPTPRLRRRTAVLVGLAASAALVGISRATWMTASVQGIAGATSQIPVRGTDAAPAVLALALVALAASLATSLSSRLIRFATGPVLILAGAGTVLAALAARSDPAARAAGAVARSTGLLGGDAQIALTPWSLIALVPALLLVALGVAVLIVGGSWPRGARYQRDATLETAPTAAEQPEEDLDPASAWDSLSRGEDPTAR